MWEPVYPRKPFYLRPWFLTTLGLCIALGGVGLLWGWAQKREWESKARAFDYRRLKEMESASIIYDRAGQVMGRIFTQNRDQVGLSELSPALLTAVVAAEDARYYQHQGVDFVGIARAMVKNFSAGRTRQGASTLTQQLARNTFPEQLPAADRGYQRKLLEMFVAFEIEKRCDKKEILELYLNRVFFGSGFYGAEAAARGYFGKSARELNLSEAATLAGLLKSPTNLSPWRNRQACIEQRNHVLQRARELGRISAEDYERTLAQDLIVKNRRPIHQESYAADMVAQQVEKLVGRDSAVSDGYRIYTTLDSALQKKAEQALRDQLLAMEHRDGFGHQTYADYDRLFKANAKSANAPGGAGEPGGIALPEYLQGSVVVLENATGGILALVGGRDFQHSAYNRAVSARVPAGTAFKPLVYAAAFENGLFPGTLVQDAVIDNRQVMIGGTTGILGEWGPERVDNKYEGLITAREALVKSKNAATVRLGNLARLDQVLAMAKNSGIESTLRPFPATFLGSSEVTLMEMTLAQTPFPNGGWRPSKAFIIQRIEDQSGNVIFQAKPETQRVMKPTTAYEVHSCLSEVLTRGTADKAFTDLGLKKFELGGKTGTAYNFTDVWFVGYSSAITCGVWTGFDKPRTSIYRGAFGGEIALPVWANVMRHSFADYKPSPITAPKGLIRCELCAASGLLATDKCHETVENKQTGAKEQRRTTFFEMATEVQAPKDACDVHGPQGRSFVKVIPGQQWPRAALAVDVAAHVPVVLKAPSVVGGGDPYQSMQSVQNLINAQKLNGQIAPVDSTANVPEPVESPANAPEVRRAEPVSPAEQIGLRPAPVTIEPPEAIRF